MTRDITLEDTIYMLFTTRAFATGIPTVLAGTPVVSAYENEGLTQITAGITLGVDHDGVVGLNLLTIVATAANGYELGKDYAMVITTGTVATVSVVGEVVAEFTIGRSAAAVDLANATDGLGAIKADTAVIGALGAGLTGIPWNAAWDAEVQSEVNDGLVALNLDHVIPVAGTVSDAGVAATDFDTDLSEVTDNHYRNQWCLMVDGALAGKGTRVSAYTGSTKNLTFEPDFDEAPANGDAFVLIPLPFPIFTTDGMFHVDVREVIGTAPTLSGGLQDVNVQTQDNIDFGATQKASINTEVVDVLNVDTYAEPAQGAPVATTSLAAKINHMYKSWRNKKEQTATTWSLYDDAGSTVDAKSTVSDDATTATRGEIISGP